jgi:hypothetical protein
MPPPHEAAPDPGTHDAPDRTPALMVGCCSELDPPLAGEVDHQVWMHGNAPFEMSLSKYVFRNNRCQAPETDL